jgi:hypothetical protein
MTDDKSQPEHKGWEPLPHEPMPNATYFPAGMAMGTMFIFWGLVTSWVIGLVGVGLFVAALAGWITEIRHERNQPKSTGDK